MNKDLIEILEAFSHLGIGFLKYQGEDFSLELGKEREKKEFAENPPSTCLKTIEKKEEPVNTIQVKSPVVGIFFSRPSPDKDAFVQVGDIVEKGQTLCLIEAMKMYNEIKSPVGGKVKKILFKDQELVAYEEVIIEMEEEC